MNSADALALAESRVAAVGDDPAARLAQPSSQAVRLWLEFSARPTGRNWYGAHNANIVGGYLAHRDLADAEAAPERFFMNVALVRVLYAHALVGAPSLALGRLGPVGRVLGDPRGCSASTWSAHDLDEPRLLELVREGNPVYAWPLEQRHVWRTPDMPLAARVLQRVTRAR